MKEELLAIASLPEERRLQVAALLRRETKVRVDDLAEHFAVSGETIRRDLKVLEDRGIARRVYGGAVVVDADAASMTAPPIQRLDGDPSAERTIAATAAALVQPGETLMLDAGTLATETARALPLTFTGRVLCSSARTAALLADRPGLEVHVAGGRLRPGDLACLDDAAAEYFDRFFAHRAFIVADGVDARAGLTCQNLEEIPVRKAMLRQSAQAYVLADSAKLGTTAVGRIGPLSAVAGIITDAAADPRVIQGLESAGVRVHVASAVPALGTAA